MPDFPITVTDDSGDRIEIAARDGQVILRTRDSTVLSFGRAQRNEFDQAYLAASHEADRQAGTVDGA